LRRVSYVALSKSRPSRTLIRKRADMLL
jgi:hypothetical protein